jgi:hypothetical protein
MPQTNNTADVFQNGIMTMVVKKDVGESSIVFLF